MSWNYGREFTINKWAIISMIVPAIIAPIVGIILTEAVSYVRKKYKKKKR